MGKEILTFQGIEHSLVFLIDVDFEKVLVLNKIYFGEKSYKYFIGYLYNDHKFKPIHTMFAKTSAYVKRYDGSRTL